MTNNYMICIIYIDTPLHMHFGMRACFTPSFLDSRFWFCPSDLVFSAVASQIYFSFSVHSCTPLGEEFAYLQNLYLLFENPNKSLTGGEWITEKVLKELHIIVAQIIFLFLQTCYATNIVRKKT